MTWTIDVEEGAQCARVTTAGVVDKEGSLAMVEALAETLRGREIRRVLIDHRRIDAVAGTTMDVYRRPGELALLGVSRGIRVAEIVRNEHRPFFDFLETVCVNRGYNFAIFGDEDSARDWLGAS